MASSLFNFRVPKTATPAERLVTSSLGEIAPSSIRQNSMQSDEIKRILNLPASEGLSPEEVEYISSQHILVEAFREGFRLLPKQAEAISEFRLNDCGFFPIGVGGGKTGISLILPQISYTRGVEKMVLIIPSQLAEQLITQDIPFWRKRTPISYPIIVLSGRSIRERRRLSRISRPGLYIMSDSQMSTEDTHEIFENLSPELMICDEAHLFSSNRSARGKRLKKILELHQPLFVPMSGTITAKSLMDYFHLARAALGDNCFLPKPTSMVQTWAQLLDAESTKGDVDTSAWSPGPLKPLLKWASDRTGETYRGVGGFREAYQLRLRTSPGVVSSGADDIGTGLLFRNNPIPSSIKAGTEGYDKMEELGRKVEEEWVTPNGDNIDHAFHTWKWLYQIYGAGFYTEAVWPTVERLVERHPGWNTKRASDMLSKAVDYHAASQEFNRVLRTWLNERHIDGMDTPMLVCSNMANHGSENVPYELYQSWIEKRESDFEERNLLVQSDCDEFGRLKNAVRICPFKINQALEWAKTVQGSPTPGGIIWVYHIEMGIWMREVMEEAGLKPVYCPAGPEFNSEIIDHQNSDKIVIASISAHGTGKNLQHFQNQWFLQWPRSAKIAEQTLGRLHRPGQKADVLEVNLCNSSLWDEMTFAATLNDSLYIHQTTGVAQKLIIGGYDPVPRIFPNAVLRQKVKDVKRLSTSQEGFLKERFKGA